jgi:hypothetical protein
VARLHRLIGQFPNYNGYRNNNRPTLGLPRFDGQG